MPSLKEIKLFANELHLFLYESAEFQQDESVQQMLRTAVTILSKVSGRIQQSSERYVVAVVGLGNVGKSTLINALFGIDLAPRRNGPCTAVPIEFTYADRPQIELYNAASFQRQKIHCHTTDELKNSLMSLAEGVTGTASRTIERIAVRFPHPLLAEKFVLVDTPGFGAVQIGDAAQSHEDSLRKYLSQSVSQILWITLGEQGIGSREKQFYEQFLKDTCDDLVLTGCEEWDKQDKKRYRHRFAPLLENELRMHFVSGIDHTGISDLEKRIRDLADIRLRMQGFLRQLATLCKDIVTWLEDYQSEAQNRVSIRWRMDSWLRLQSIANCSDLFRQICASLQRLRYSEVT